MAFLVDIPSQETVLNEEGPWTFLGSFPTRAEAVKFIRDTIGPCDDRGNICLITDCPDDDSSEVTLADWVGR